MAERGRPKAPLVLTDDERQTLQRWSRRSKTSQDIMRLLERINRTGTTVVMATHDERIVDQMRRRVVELEHGKVVRDQERGVYGTRDDPASI